MNSMTRWIETAGAEDPGRDEILEFVAPDVGWIKLQWWAWLAGAVAISDMTEIDAAERGDLYLPIDPPNGWLDKPENAVTLVALVFHAGEAARQTD